MHDHGKSADGCLSESIVGELFAAMALFAALAKKNDVHVWVVFNIFHFPKSNLLRKLLLLAQLFFGMQKTELQYLIGFAPITEYL